MSEQYPALRLVEFIVRCRHCDERLPVENRDGAIWHDEFHGCVGETVGYVGLVDDAEIVLADPFELELVERTRDRADQDVDAYLSFANEYVDEILAGEKTATIRYQLSRYVSAGQSVALIDESGDVFATATITAVETLTARELVGVPIEGHREYESLDALSEAMSVHYDVAPEWFDASTVFDLVRFDVDEPGEWHE